jgi:hypothetical protein
VVKNTPIWIRSVAVVMLVAMTYYFAGYRLVYTLLTKDAQHKASSAIENKNTVLEKMVLDKAEFSKLKWTEDNKEFSYKGQLYDVASVSEIAGWHSIQVYVDKNETSWIKSLNNFVKQLFPADNSQSNKNAESIMSAFHKEYVSLNKVSIKPPVITNVIRYSCTLDFTGTCAGTSIWHPPTLS